MYSVNIKIDSERRVEMSSASGGITGENNATVLNFSIPEEYSDFNKYLDIYKDDGERIQTVLSISDEKEFSYILPGELADNLNVYMQIVMKKGTSVFKSYRFSLVFEEGINATSYMESEHTDSIETLFEIKADKSELDGLLKSVENKVAFSVFSEEISNINAVLSNKAEKSEIPKVPVKISDFIDDTGDLLNPKPIAYANHSKTSEYADKAETANVSEESRRDSRGNIIYETYATKSEASKIETSLGEDISEIEKSIGDIKTALNEIIAIQNQLMGVNE